MVVFTFGNYEYMYMRWFLRSKLFGTEHWMFKQTGGYFKEVFTNTGLY